jgi:hypothetical protein
MPVNVLNIVEGFKNFTFPSPIHEEMARVRAEICAPCEHANPEHPFTRFFPKALKKKDRIKKIIGLGCNKCHCLISAKVRAPKEKCPLGLW